MQFANKANPSGAVDREADGGDDEHRHRAERAAGEPAAEAAGLRTHGAAVQGQHG